MHMRLRLPEVSITLSRSAAAHLATGFALVLPFMLLEVFVGGASLRRFPFPLFSLLWFLGVSFSLIMRPLATALVRGETNVTGLAVLPRGCIVDWCCFCLD